MKTPKEKEAVFRTRELAVDFANKHIAEGWIINMLDEFEHEGRKLWKVRAFWTPLVGKKRKT